MKLTPEQFEDILSGAAPQGSDIDAEDIVRLEEARAIRTRLAAAFDSTHAADSLADKVRASLSPPTARRARFIYFPTGLLSAVAAASGGQDRPRGSAMSSGWMTISARRS